MIDLNPKKYKTKRDNVFMDFMALYSRASSNDKAAASRRRSASVAGRTNRPLVSGQ